jgi:hypothetical protein
MSVQNTVHGMGDKLSSRQDGKSPGRQAQHFNVKMLKGDVRGDAKYLTDMEKGGALLPDGIDENSGLAIT